MIRQMRILVCVCVLALCFVLPVAAQDAAARVRVVHAAQEVQSVDVFVDDKPVFADLSFPEQSGYLDLPAGAHTLALAPADSGPNEVVLTTSLALEAGQFYTVVALGANALDARTFTDDLSSLPPNKARVRFIHTSPDAPGVDIEVINGPTLFASVEFGQASDYQLVDAGTYNLRAVANGNNAVFLQLPATTLQAGNVYDIVAVGRLANLKIQVLAAPAQPRNASVPNTPATQQMMPATGSSNGRASDHIWLLALAAVLIIVSGTGLRYASRPRRSVNQ